MKKNLLSISITTGAYADVVRKVCQLPLKRKSSYVCVANVHMLVEAHEDERFGEVVNNADVVTADGKPLCMTYKMLYGEEQDRVAGMFLMQDVMAYAEKNSTSVFFYGGTEAMLAQTESYTEKYFPNLKLAGLYSPPFRALSKQEDQEIVDMINASGASYVMVALGCPKQERWMASMRGRINACMIGIGGALPVMIGMKRKAPMWIQNYGLEWLFRLSQEPKRLFKRYWHTNRIFATLLLKEMRMDKEAKALKYK